MSGGPGLAAALHLARRFFGSITPGAPAPSDERWAMNQLLQGEAEIWCRMSNPDRRHAVGVARAVVADRERSDPGGPAHDRSVVAAALLHDCGKVVSGLRTPARVMATVLWAVADDDLADRWLSGDPAGRRTRLAQYRRHPELGAELLQAAGADPLTYRWAAEHHQPEPLWTIPTGVGRILKACDDD